MVKRMYACVWCASALLAGCVGELGDNQGKEPVESVVDQGSGGALVDMSSSGRDMDEPSAGEDMSSTRDLGEPGDMSVDMAAPGPRLPDYTDPSYNPNAAFQGRQSELFECSDLSAPLGAEAITLSRLQRLESVEWVRNTGLFFGTRHTRVKTNYPAEADRTPFEVEVAGGYSTWRNQAHMNSAIISGHVDLMPYASQNWIKRVHVASQDAALDCMYDGDAAVDEQCATTFASTLLGEGMLFRPPSAEEVTQLVDYAMQDVLPDEALKGQTRDQSIELIYAAAQLTTAVLYKSERGELGAQPDEHGRVALTNWELAHKIGYALKRRAPGAPALKISYGGSPATVNNRWDLPEEERSSGHMSAILQAARDGSIQDRAVLADLIRQEITGVDPERYDLPTEWRQHNAMQRRGVYWMSEGVRRFFREWLEADYILSSFKDTPYATSKHSEENTSKGGLNAISRSYDSIRLGPSHTYEPTLLQQLDDTIARVVQADEDVLANLLTTREYYTSTGEAVAATNQDVPHFVYNVEEPVEIGSQESRWRTMPESERAGILTHPTWLAAHSDNFEDGPAIVKRGYWIQKHLLCGSIPEPPGQIDLTLPDIPDQSARERIYGGTEDPANPKTAQCQACHAKMNPLGYPFEFYNHAGFLREDDHGSPRDGSSLLHSLPANSDLAVYNDTMVDDPMEFAAILAGSTHVKQCFIRHTFRYFMGRPETEADACTLAQMEHAYDLHNGSFVEMLVALMTSDAFLYTRPWSDLEARGGF